LRKVKKMAAKFLTGLAVIVSVILVNTTNGLVTPPEELSIEDVTRERLDKLLDTTSFMAVYWYARNCKRSENILKDMELIDDDAKKSNIEFVKINDKRFGKSFGVKKFPALTFFRGREVFIFDGDLKDEEAVLEFITDEDNMAMPDKIEDVDAEQLISIVETDPFVTVFFYDESKTSSKALEHMEDIDDETDVFQIRFLRINDRELAEDYSLPRIPCLVFFRREIPIVYAGDMNDENEMLEWLIKNQSSADDDDVLEHVDSDQLEIMVENVDNLMIYFYDNTRMSTKIFDVMETIDDDCDTMDVVFVAVKDKTLAAKYNVDEFPTLMFFENQIPSVYDGELENPGEILAWIADLLTGADIEQVTNDILDKFISTKSYLAVVFFREDDPKSTAALDILEEIDDDLDEVGIMFVKLDDEQEAAEYGIETFPSLVVFENGIPNLYDGSFESGEEVLGWVVNESSGDHTIEIVTDNMLDQIVADHDNVAVVFYKKGEDSSESLIEMLEHIDDEAIENEFPIKLLRIDDDNEAAEYGIDSLPALVYFDKRIPNIYSGEMDTVDILMWMTEQTEGSHIEEISEELLQTLIKKHDDLTVFFYDKDVKQERKLLEELENVDHILENQGINLVKIDDASGADKFGVEVIPAIVHFQFKEPHVFKGDLTNEKKIVEWVLKIRES